MEELLVEVNWNMSVELQSLTCIVVPIGLGVAKPLETDLVPHVDPTVQLITVTPLLVQWYEATSPEHTGPGPTSCVD